MSGFIHGNALFIGCCDLFHSSSLLWSSICLLSFSRFFLWIISFVFLRVRISRASSNVFCTCESVFHFANFICSFIRRSCSCLNLALVFQSTFSKSIYLLYKSRSSSFFHIFLLPAVHSLSNHTKANAAIGIPRHPNMRAHHAVDPASTAIYLHQLVNRELASLYFIFASLTLFTIELDILVSSTRFFIPGKIASIWFRVSSSHFSILFFALSFRSHFLFITSSSNWIFSFRLEN